MDNLFIQLTNTEYLKENKTITCFSYYNKSYDRDEINVIFVDTDFGVDIIKPYESIAICLKVKYNDGWVSCRLLEKGINEVYYCKTMDDTIEYLKKLSSLINNKVITKSNVEKFKEDTFGE